MIISSKYKYEKRTQIMKDNTIYNKNREFLDEHDEFLKIKNIFIYKNISLKFKFIKAVF